MNVEPMKGFVRLAPVLLPVIVLAAMPVDAPAADADGAPRRITRPSGPLRSAKSGARKSPGVPYWQTMAVLAGIVVVIVVGAKFLKKHGPLLTGGIPEDALEVLGKRAIDRGQTIYLVRLAGRILVIGSSTGGLQTLGEVTDPVEIDYLAGVCRQSSERSALTQGFLTLFNRQFGRNDPEANAAPTSSGVSESQPAAAPEREHAHV